jgi:hypothetical protein
LLGLLGVVTSAARPPTPIMAMPVLEEVIQQLEAEPVEVDEEMTGLSFAERRTRRLKGRPSPMPYNWVDKGNGVFLKLTYSAMATGKDWRYPTVETTEATMKRPEPQPLFGIGESYTFSKQPTELLITPPLSKQEKKEKRAAAAEEKKRLDLRSCTSVDDAIT